MELACSPSRCEGTGQGARFETFFDFKLNDCEMNLQPLLFSLLLVSTLGTGTGWPLGSAAGEGAEAAESCRWDETLL